MGATKPLIDDLTNEITDLRKQLTAAEQERDKWQREALEQASLVGELNAEGVRLIDERAQAVAEGAIALERLDAIRRCASDRRATLGDTPDYESAFRGLEILCGALQFIEQHATIAAPLVAEHLAADKAIRERLVQTSNMIAQYGDHVGERCRKDGCSCGFDDAIQYGADSIDAALAPPQARAEGPWKDLPKTRGNRVRQARAEGQEAADG